MVDGGGCGGDGRGKKCGGRDGGDDSEYWDSSNHEFDRTNLFYEQMIQANPGNSLLLGNYARFLKEVLVYYIINFNLNVKNKNRGVYL